MNVAYAVGTPARLRAGEILALRREHVDLASRRIHVRESIEAPLKDSRGCPSSTPCTQS